MPCYKPLKAYYGPGGPKFKITESFGTRHPIELPCGRCIGCRLQKAKEWALRCTHEAQMHEHNQFVTLTYNDPSLPENYSLDHLHFQKFIRALRQGTGKKIRYYMCGEYGNICPAHGHWVEHPIPDKPETPQCGTCRTGRPHYHAILFGLELPDRYLWYVRNGNRMYRSPTLEKYWHRGNSECTDVTFQSSGYVARYCLKKQNGEYALRTYGILDPDTGEISQDEIIKPPYTCMSLKKGIGETWYEKYKSDLFPHDYAITPDGRQTPVPAYYRRLLEAENPKLSEKLRKARVEKARLNTDNSDSRLAVREHCQQEKAKRLIRSL